MSKAKFFLGENRNAQIDPANGLPSDIYLPANNGRDVVRNAGVPQGSFNTTPPNNSISLSDWLENWLENNGDAAVYPLEGAFVVDADTIDMTSAADFDINTTTDFDVNATTAVTIDSGTTTTITGGTGLTLDVTTGDMGLNSTDGDVIISPAVNFTATASTGDVTLTSTAADVNINAGDDIILTPTGNLTFALAAIPTYADDAAAGVGGLTAGQVYKTAAGALMIKL